MIKLARVLISNTDSSIVIDRYDAIVSKSTISNTESSIVIDSYMAKISKSTHF